MTASEQQVFSKSWEIINKLLQINNPIVKYSRSLWFEIFKNFHLKHWYHDDCYHDEMSRNPSGLMVKNATVNHSLFWSHIPVRFLSLLPKLWKKRNNDCLARNFHEQLQVNLPERTWCHRRYTVQLREKGRTHLSSMKNEEQYLADIKSFDWF